MHLKYSFINFSVLNDKVKINLLIINRIHLLQPLQHKLYMRLLLRSLKFSCTEDALVYTETVVNISLSIIVLLRNDDEEQ